MIVYELPPSRYDRVRPLFASERYDEPFRDEVFEGKLALPVFADDPVVPTSAIVCHPFEFYLAGPVSPALRVFCADAPEEPGAFQRFYGYATAGDAWKNALLEDTPLAVIDRRNYKWPLERPAPDWRSRLPAGATVAPMNRALAERVDRELNEHLAPQWEGYENFARYGAGRCVFVGDTLASVAYALAASDQHANFGVATVERFRRRGLASIACAALIEHYLAHGVQPTWCTDAFNSASCDLAHSLGFVEDMSFVQVSPEWGKRLTLSHGRWTRGDTTPDGVTAWIRG